MPKDKLNSYRFSNEEMKKMIWLNELFDDNGFTIERFPEVFYDTFEKACEVFPSLKENNEQDGTPDYLGVYIYTCEDNTFGKTEEGIIILFSDRIYNYSSLVGLSESCVRFVVLMHELGHWLSHWPCGNNLRWLFGFQLPIKRTKEALANIIAYWCLESDCHKTALAKLTPKLPELNGVLHIIVVNSTGIDTENPYGAYTLLLPKSQQEILEKIKLLRAAFYLSDSKMMEFLQSDIQTLPEFLAEGYFEDHVEAGMLEDIMKTPLLSARGESNSIAVIFKDRSKDEKVNNVFKGAYMSIKFGLGKADFEQC